MSPTLITLFGGERSPTLILLTLENQYRRERMILTTVSLERATQLKVQQHP